MTIMHVRIVSSIVIGIIAAVVTAQDAPVTKPYYSTSVEYNVTCSPKWMIVTVSVNSSNALVYLERMKNYIYCEPEKLDGMFVFKFSLENIYTCATARMINKMTGVKIYYNRIIVEEPNEDLQMILAECRIPPTHNTTSPHLSRPKRDSFPENFVEPEHINITEYIVARGPVPYLNLAIRQHGKILDTNRNIQPGTPLEMLIYLDKKSAETYGLLTSFLKVTDSTPNQEEVIIMNGCSIDPYIFGNFQSLENGDALSAKFRAFKFPDANYVLFVGTVSVCLQECKGVPCGNGQLGFGRRKRRSIPTDLPTDPNKLFEVEMTTFLKVEYTDDHFTLNKGSLKGDFDSQLQKSEEVVNTTYSASNKVAALYVNSGAICHKSWALLGVTLSSLLVLTTQLGWLKHSVK